MIGDPLQLGGVRLRNRFVSAPMERNYCEIDGTVTCRNGSKKVVLKYQQNT